MSTTFTKATRRKQKLKIGISGPSGSGKSLGALALAHQLVSSPDKVAAIDTENGSLSLYGDRYPFDTLEIGAPYLSSKYLEAIDAAVEAGYEALVIDSITHQWDGDGGILQRKDEADARPGSNHWTNWGPFTKEHNEFRAKLLSAPIHIIATMRSKMAYQQTDNGGGSKGSKKIEKLGLQPIQREGLEYEFALTFDVQMDHKADASKDRTSLFVGKRTDLLDPKTGKKLLDWLETAAPELPPAPAPAPPAPAVEAPARRDPAPAAARPASQSSNGKATMSPAMLTLLADGKMPMGHNKGQLIAKLSDKDLLSALTWCRETDAQKFSPLIHALETAYQALQPVSLPGLDNHDPKTFEQAPAGLDLGGDDDLPF